MGDPTTPAIFGVLAERMRFLGERQRVIAENIANANTPNYAARDLRDTDFFKALQKHTGQLALTATNGAHLAPVQPTQRYAIDKVKSPYETKLDKNGVVLEEQMMKMAETSSAYGSASQLYKKYIDMLKMAIPKA